MDSSFETKVLKEKTEKLGFVLVIVSVLIPVVLIAIGFYGYAELKNSITTLEQARESNIKKAASELENKIFKTSAKTEELESRLTDFKTTIDSNTSRIKEVSTNINNDRQKLFSDLKKNIKDNSVKTEKNSGQIQSLIDESNKLQKQIKESLSSFAKLEKNYTEIKNRQNEILKRIDENKSVIPGLKSTISDIEQKMETFTDQETTFEDLKKSLGNLNKTIETNKKRTDNLEDKIIFLENEMNKNSDLTPGNNSAIIEQDITD
jgi:chromosome segregation ATPase